VLEHDGVHEVDYLCGDDPYKADWMAQRRERVGLVAFDLRRWRGLSAAAQHTAGRLLKRFRPAAPGADSSA
jgi:CelD/BcsL family acetyltransferase involved in cellulose biosynthesis